MTTWTISSMCTLRSWCDVSVPHPIPGSQYETPTAAAAAVCHSPRHSPDNSGPVVSKREGERERAFRSIGNCIWCKTDQRQHRCCDVAATTGSTSGIIAVFQAFRRPRGSPAIRLGRVAVHIAKSTDF